VEKTRKEKQASTLHNLQSAADANAILVAFDEVTVFASPAELLQRVAQKMQTQDSVCVHACVCDIKLIDWFGFRSNLNTERLYRATEKYVAVNIEINEKFENVTCWQYPKWYHYNKYFQSGLAGETLWH